MPGFSKAQLQQALARVRELLLAPDLSPQEGQKLERAKLKLDRMLIADEEPQQEPELEPQDYLPPTIKSPRFRISAANFLAPHKRRARKSFWLAMFFTALTALYYGVIAAWNFGIRPFFLMELATTVYSVIDPASLSSLLTLLIIVWWPVYGINYVKAFLIARRDAKRPHTEAEQVSDLDEGIDDLNEDQEAEPESELENGDIPPNKIDYIIRKAAVNRRIRSVITRAVVLSIMLYISFWTLTNIDSIITFGLSLVFWSLIFIQLNAAYPALMGMLYTVLGLFLLILYLIPYRIMRKELRAVYGKQTKSLGRKVMVKGVDEFGNPPDSFLYSMWYSFRHLAHLLHNKKGIPWSQARPHPHEFPFGDVFYLRGNPYRGIPKFRWMIVYKSNVLGIIRRQFRPRILYSNAQIEQSLFTIRLIGDGVNVLEVPRLSEEGGLPHQELSPVPMQYRPRPRGPYAQMVDEGLEMSAGRVDRGVRSDAELAKESVREFTLPAPSVVYRGLGGDEESKPEVVVPEITEPKRPKEPKDDDEEGDAEVSDKTGETD